MPFYFSSQVFIIVLPTSECKHDDLIPCVFAAEGVSGQGAGPQVPGHHEEPGAEIRHPGAEEGGERGRHRG